MPTHGPRQPTDKFARRGDAIYDRDLQPTIERDHPGKFVAIDIEVGAFEVDANEMVASRRLRARISDARTGMRRVGFPYVHHFGGRSTVSHP